MNGSPNTSYLYKYFLKISYSRVLDKLGPYIS